MVIFSFLHCPLEHLQSFVAGVIEIIQAFSILKCRLIALVLVSGVQVRKNMCASFGITTNAPPMAGFISSSTHTDCL